jgi:hypothetical protein
LPIPPYTGRNRCPEVSLQKIERGSVTSLLDISPDEIATLTSALTLLFRETKNESAQRILRELQEESHPSPLKNQLSLF